MLGVVEVGMLRKGEVEGRKMGRAEAMRLANSLNPDTPD
jgi:hypothetical protein